MSVKVSHKKIATSDLVVDLGLNPRRDSYDLPSMKEQILAIGRVTDSIVVEPHPDQKGKYRVLKGNRRTLAAQELIDDPNLAQGVHEAISKLEADVHEGLSDRERLSLVYDHGQQNQLTRAEIVVAVWKLSRNTWTEREIAVAMYQALARFTGQLKKINEAQHVTDPKEREKFITKWLHGTVGNYLLAAETMGEFIRSQVYLAELSADRPLNDKEKAAVVFSTSRTRINELNSAKQKDKKEGGWNPLDHWLKEEAFMALSPEQQKDYVKTETGHFIRKDEGGAEFNATIERFIKEDTSETSPKETRMTMKDLERRSDAARSGDLRRVYQRIMGKPVEGFDFDALDTEMHRRDKVFDFVRGNIDNIKDQTVRELLVAITYKGETEVQTAVKPFLKS